MREFSYKALSSKDVTNTVFLIDCQLDERSGILTAGLVYLAEKITNPEIDVFTVSEGFSNAQSKKVGVLMIPDELLYSSTKLCQTNMDFEFELQELDGN